MSAEKLKLLAEVEPLERDAVEQANDLDQQISDQKTQIAIVGGAANRLFQDKSLEVASLEDQLLKFTRKAKEIRGQTSFLIETVLNDVQSFVSGKKSISSDFFQGSGLPYDSGGWSASVSEEA